VKLRSTWEKVQKQFSYYPGCTLHSTGKEYGQSTTAVCAALGIELIELADWNCCGASSAHSLNEELALTLPARNLAIAQAAGRDVVIPCAACFNRHKIVDYVLSHEATKRRDIEAAVGFQYTGSVRHRNLVDIFANEVGVERLAAAVKRPLAGLQAVSYYGCLLVRPPEVTQFDDPEHPVLLDRLLEALGAEPQEWSFATECCGGSLTLNRADVVQPLVANLIAMAQEAGAACIVTACPLCQANLETRQGKANFPIFYFTELIGLALGLPAANRWFAQHLVDPRPLLQRLTAV
jgi:heterodisulfide reductase subunit B